jgi:tetratricopeptide (TPR) repeat protein
MMGAAHPTFLNLMDLLTRSQHKNLRLEAIKKEIELLIAAIIVEPSNWKAYLDRGMHYLYINNAEAAISDYTQLINKNKFLREAYIGRGHAQNRLGNKLEALADYRLAIRADSIHIHAYYLCADIERKLGNLEAAIDTYSQAIAIDSQDAAAHHNRASAKEKLGRYKEAILDYTKAIEIHALYDGDRDELDIENAGYLSAYFARGNVKLKSGDRQGAMADYAEVITFRAITTDDLLEIGKARRYIGDREGAIRDFTRIIAPDRSCSFTAYYERAITKLELGDLNGAIDDATLAIDFHELYEGEFDKNIALELIENIRVGRHD